MRTWPEDWEARRRGDGVLTHEHTASRWVEPQEYIERWCNKALEERFPAFATWSRQVRLNCELVRERLASRRG